MKSYVLAAGAVVAFVVGATQAVEVGAEPATWERGQQGSTYYSWTLNTYFNGYAPVLAPDDFINPYTGSVQPTQAVFGGPYGYTDTAVGPNGTVQGVELAMDADPANSYRVRITIPNTDQEYGWQFVLMTVVASEKPSFVDVDMATYFVMDGDNKVWYNCGYMVWNHEIPDDPDNWTYTFGYIVSPAPENEMIGLCFQNAGAVVDSITIDTINVGDCNGNAYPDILEEDCNDNGIPDDCDIASGYSVDANGDGIPDECASPVVPGDVNCDGIIDVFDIDPFVMAMARPAEYATNYPDCDVISADTNEDGIVDVFDIEPFVAILVGGGE